MSDYRFRHIAKADLDSLKQGVWIWVWNVDKTPPHLGMASNGMYYSLKYNGKDIEIPVETLFRVIGKEHIPTVFMSVNEQFSQDYISKVFSQHDCASSGGVTCLKPIAEVFNAAECRTIFDLLTMFSEHDKINSVSGLYLPSSFQGIPFYTYESVQMRLKELENVKVG
ncbi:MAG: hypothetical protein RIT43_2307 [Bacteroidota bacterium]|jgi:hypothetical protein